MKKGIAYRKAQNERIIKKRRKIWAKINSEWAKREDVQGKFRKTNFSCNCGGCKPHKHGLDKKLKTSDLRRLGYKDEFDY